MSQVHWGWSGGRSGECLERSRETGESIQTAIDHARPGDTIRVAAGEFRENLTITTDGITLRGAGSGRDGTVLTPPSDPVLTVGPT